MVRHSTGSLVRVLVAGRQLLVAKRQPSGNLIPATGGSPPIDSRHAMPLVSTAPTRSAPMPLVRRPHRTPDGPGRLMQEGAVRAAVRGTRHRAVAGCPAAHPPLYRGADRQALVLREGCSRQKPRAQRNRIGRRQRFVVARSAAR